MKYKYLYVLSLAIISSTSSHAIAADTTSTFRPSEFILDQSAQVVTIDNNGSEIYLYYRGPSRSPESINISIDDPSIKLSGSSCTISKTNDRCKIVLRYASLAKPAYTDKAITVRDSGNSLISEYIVWVKPTYGPFPLAWRTRGDAGTRGAGPIIIQNANQTSRTYQIDIDKNPYTGFFTDDVSIEPSYSFTLPAKSVCKADESLIINRNAKFEYTYATPMNGAAWGSDRNIKDITDASQGRTTYNSPYVTGNNNISTCAANGVRSCSSLWGSWTVGIMNISGKDLNPTFLNGDERLLKNGSWESNDNIYYESGWVSNGNEQIALIAINGATNGNGFDASSLRLPMAAVVTAPPCSFYKRTPLVQFAPPFPM